MKRTTLGEIVEGGGGFIQTGPFGSQLHASDYLPEGVPVVMPQNIVDGFIDESGVARVSAEDAERLDRHRVTEGDILYSRRGDVERCAFIRAHEGGWLCGTGCLRVHFGDEPVVDPKFIAYTLALPEVRSWIRGHAVGATMLNLNTTILSSVPLNLPTYNEQRAIAEVLGALDDKITANERTVDLLSQLQNALYFGSLRSAAETKVVDSLVSLLVRGVAPKYVEGSGVLVLNQKCIRNGRVNLDPARLTNPSGVREDRLLQFGDILVNSTGTGTLGRVSRWTRAERAAVDSHVSIVRADANKVDVAVFGAAMSQKQAVIEGLAEGSTGQTELSRSQLGGIVLQLPPRESQAALGRELDEMAMAALAAETESRHLAAMRDALLPELMSGRMTVRQAESQVEEVL